MFEVIFSKVKTGKVERKLFETLEAAEAYRERREARLLTPKRPGQWGPSLGDFRFEIRRVEAVVVRPLAVRGLAA
jgi:hypothetical protein